MNKIAIVTGGTRGIGEAILDKLVSEGFDVYFTFQKGIDKARYIEGLYANRVRGFQVNSSNPDEIEKFALSLKEKPIAILVNNAGINRDNLFVSTKPQDISEVVITNIVGTMMYCRHILPIMMKNRDGIILNISSRASSYPKVGNAVYGATKIAIERFSETIAMEYERFGISINSIAPSYVDTEMIKKFIPNMGNKNGNQKKQNIKIRTVHEVANMAWILINKELDMSGKTLQI